MRDQLNWYLIEMDQALKRTTPEAERNSFLREAESHIRDHAADLESKGMEPADAINSAILAFGPPQAATEKRRELPRRWRYAVIAILTLMAMWIIPVIAFRSSDILTPYYVDLPVDFFIWTTIIIGSVLVAAIWLRKWIAPTVTGFALLFTVFYVAYISLRSTVVQLDGHRRITIEREIPRMINAREQWLKDATAQRALIETFLRTPTIQQADVVKQFAVETGIAYYTFPSDIPDSLRAYGMSQTLLPGKRDRTVDFSLVTFSVERNSDRNVPYLSQTQSLSEAVEMWRKNGQKYLAATDTRSELVARQINDLRNPITVPKWDIFNQILPVPFFCVVFTGLFATLLNAVIIAAFKLAERAKRRAWHRRFV